MKKLTFTVMAALVVFFVMQSCNKEQLASVGPQIKATKIQIGIGKVDTLLLTNASNAESVNWTVSPDGKDSLSYKGNAATITFSAAGTYIVTAQQAGGLPASITITVSPGAPVVKPDTVTTKSDITTSTSDTLQLVPITNDVTIALSYYRNPAGDSVRINLMPYVYLDNYYCRNALIQFKSAITADNNFNLDLINIRESKGCAIATSPTTPSGGNTAAYDVFINKLIGFGTYPLKITVGSLTYTGNIVVSASNITFNWPYTSGVIIPQKVLPK
ncbi:MAG: hypothetical protein JWQ34_1250 [Mucilaginibacter sp.]|uniref:hypothetical protein n=1 Tax=Mucilaginibacter sp. TaxID=1882438 RepID=UPI00260DAADB|nr:hypothetical protein [Mucilaginibacter sp.]MDB5003025.1 hypothetical protein [Mucilaginibacter sp.]